ncbi:MAG: DNA polymerase 1 [Euryarchaeota archaeon ADurb.Bin165]|nr:MAG: DNA polymerase 1 [Euryarchaeota archaeon ADurb.Bin165]
MRSPLSSDPCPFVFDITRTKTGVDTWEKTDGKLSCSHHLLEPGFLLSFPDCHQYYQLLDGLASEYPVSSCLITTIYGKEEGYHVMADREVAQKIEEQTFYQARLFNVDIRPEQIFCAKTKRVVGGYKETDRFSPDSEPDLDKMEITCSENPHRSSHPGAVTISTGSGKWVLEGSERTISEDMFTIIQDKDPDIILFPDYDTWSGIFFNTARDHHLFNSFSRTGRFHTMAPRSYFSYGRMEHRLGAKIPEGRIIIDTRQSFMYREGDLRGIFLASRLTGLSPNLTSRLTPGTLISSYEVYEALARGFAVPFRKSDAEAYRKVTDMRLDYRGGYMLQPPPGIFADVTQIDFTSFYPSIIVRENLSPETLNNRKVPGFLPSVIGPVIELRHYTKRMKKTDSSYAGMDGILKWMLVTCFGYTGYKNARFGRIEVHEEITLAATRILKDCVKLTESHGGKVLHAIIDCLFIQGGKAGIIQEEIEKMTTFHTEADCYDWVVFLPQSDGSGSYCSYFGRLTTGKMKVKGVLANRRTTPPYVARMQNEMMEHLCTCQSIDDIPPELDHLSALYMQYLENLHSADVRDFVITRRIGRRNYNKRCIAQAVVDRYKEYNVSLEPGMDASFVVRDEKRLVVDPSWDAEGIDARYYRRLLDKAYEEVIGMLPGKAGSSNR